MLTVLFIIGIILLCVFLLWIGALGLVIEIVCAIFGGGRGGSGGSGSSGGSNDSFGGGSFGGGGSSDSY